MKRDGHRSVFQKERGHNFLIRAEKGHGSRPEKGRTWVSYFPNTHTETNLFSGAASQQGLNYRSAQFVSLLKPISQVGVQLYSFVGAEAL